MKYYELLYECKLYPKEYEACIYIITELSKFTKSELYLHLNDDIPNEILFEMKKLIGLYVDKNIPVQYLVGYTYFYGLSIKVNPNVLIPRFETEEVVDKAINLINEKNLVKVVDVGTGSGCIAIALKKHIPNIIITAIDISFEAIKVAKENAIVHQVEIEFIENDLLSNINDEFDLIISNPPYISKDEEVMDLVYDNEPHLALFSDNDGLDHYQRILEQSHLSAKGIIIFEIADNNITQMNKLAHQYYPDVQIIKDIHNKNRIMIIQGEKI